MSDLARRAAETAAGLFGDNELIEEEEWIGLVTKAINSVGTLVSHEQAALLREVERIDRGVEVTIDQFLDGNGTPRWSVGVLVRRDVPQRFQQYAPTLTDALKSALDAAGVPDAKGT